jgi:hypothetical protein
VDGDWSGVGSEDGCAIDDRRVGEHATNSFCRFFELMARERVVADVTRLDYRPGQSWPPLQAADGGASIEAWAIKDTFTTGVVDC